MEGSIPSSGTASAELGLSEGVPVTYLETYCPLLVLEMLELAELCSE